MNIRKKAKTIFHFKLCLIFCFCLASSESRPKPKYKELKINGLLIHEEQNLIIHLKLAKLPVNKTQFKSVAKKLNYFYHAGGYVLAETFLIEETGDRLTVFVDEGRLGRIVFKRLNTPQTLRMKYEFKLEQKIYNKYAVEKELRRMEKEFGFNKITEKIMRAQEYDTALIQLNQKFDIPWFGTAGIPFLEKIGYRYNLYLNFPNDGPSGKNKKTIDIDIKTNYSKGFVPQIQYRFPSLFQEDDMLIVGASTGIRYGYYGLDVDFTKRPDWTFVETHSDYNFSHVFKEYFTPAVRTSIHNSRTSRHDLGLDEYKFLVFKGTLAPGITILKKLKLYAGLGGERVYIYGPVIDPEAVNPEKIKENVETMAFFETRLVYKFLWLPQWGKDKQMELTYRYFLNDKIFHEFFFEGNSDFELKYLSIYSFAFDYSKTWKKPPFYHEVSVSNQNFKGFTAEDYYTREIARNSHELKTSLYRAFIYFGIFTDLVWFRGSGYDLRDNQFGFVSGISGHVILLDQFQFDVYYGRDYLRSSGKSQDNIFIKLFKKW